MASVCPARTQSPGWTSTCVTMPPSPTTPTGMSTRAASDPVALIVRATVDWPGLTTVTTGAGADCGAGADSPLRVEIHAAATTSSTATPPPASNSRLRRARAASSSMMTAVSPSSCVS